MKKKGFTLIELLVVISIIALLLSILMPSLTKVKELARATVCSSNHKTLYLTSQMYLSENNDKFPWGYITPNASNTINGYQATQEEIDTSCQKRRWVHLFKPYYETYDALHCPTAPYTTGSRDSRVNINKSSWGYEVEGYAAPKGSHGSIGFNRFLYNSINIAWQDKCYKSPLNVRHPDEVPVFVDCYWIEGTFYPDTTAPREYKDVMGTVWNFYNVDRHNGYVAGIFMDGAPRKIGLKELWKLRWTKDYDGEGPYTLAGGVTEDDWPIWMKQYKAF